MSNPVLLETDARADVQAVGKSAALAEPSVCPEVNFIRQGKGAPVVMIHGLAASLRDWDFLVPDLVAGGYEACTPDLLGHGDSVKPASLEDYNAKNVFGHMAGWIESLALREPAVLIGHSLGGYLALDYALRFPERVRALILVNPFYSVRQLSSFLQFVFRRQLLNTAFIEHTPYWLFRIVIDVTSLQLGAGGKSVHFLPESVRIQTTLDYKRASPGIYNIPRTMRDLTVDLPRITAPTLVLWGARDRTLAQDSFPELARLLPSAQGEKIPSCGHVPHQCHAARFNRMVMAFLAKL
ncbi:MAG: alpha/beta hydrolase fold protein [Anaerolineaceae bacterium]|nr:MAG: alpha/beta hydrolase fold protein [Anaerolineaceae bacterium]